MEYSFSLFKIQSILLILWQHLAKKLKIRVLMPLCTNYILNTKPISFMEDSNKTNKTRYSNVELDEFRVLIRQKLARAQRELQYFSDQLASGSDNADSKPKGLDDGISTAENNNLAILAARQQKYVQHLENAIIRIDNKIYGVCRTTGKLISKERLRAVPHATLSMEAKMARK
jgi:DnaK suppressor protein